MQGCYDEKNLTSLVLTGCYNVSASALEEVLRLFPCISYIDIRGCNQFKEIQAKHPNISWIKRSGLCKTKNHEESYSKIRSLKQITGTYRSLGSHLEESDDLENYCNGEFNCLDRKNLSCLKFTPGVYKRPKLVDARRSSELLSRDAQMRRWLHRKTEISYKKMEEFIANTLKDIMRGSKSEFFMPKVLPSTYIIVFRHSFLIFSRMKMICLSSHYYMIYVTDCKN